MTEQEPANDWSGDERRRRAFWATAGGLGFDQDDVHRILEVESLYLYEGGLQDALRQLNAAAGVGSGDQPQDGRSEEVRQVLPDTPEAEDEADNLLELDPRREDLARQLREAQRDMPEAIASASAYMQSNKGTVWLVTVRAGVQQPLMIEAMLSVVTTIETLEKAVYHRHRGWKPVLKSSDVFPSGMNLPGGGSTVPLSATGVPRVPRSTPATDSRWPDHQNIRQTVLQELKIGRDGRYEFTVTGMQWPLIDTRGFDTVPDLFEEACFSPNFSRSDIGRRGVYDNEDWGGSLTCTIGRIERPGREGQGSRSYWDVLEVRRTSG